MYCHEAGSKTTILALVAVLDLRLAANPRIQGTDLGVLSEIKTDPSDRVQTVILVDFLYGVREIGLARHA